MKQLKDKNKQNKNTLGSSIAIGLSLGMAYGVIMDQLALWISLGLCLGIIVGSLNQRRHDKNKRLQEKINKRE